MIPLAEGMAANCEYQDVMADLFHALSQPLTTLQCCLTGSLHRPQSAGRYRRDLQMVLQQSKQVVFLTTAIRELVACEISYQPLQKSDLGACVSEVVDDLLPVAKSAGVELRLTSSGKYDVKLETHRLRQAVFYLVESALNHSQRGSRISIRLTRERREARLAVRISVLSRKKPELFHRAGGIGVSALHRRLTLAIARRTFESAAGSFQIHRRARQITLTIRLPQP